MLARARWFSVYTPRLSRNEYICENSSEQTNTTLNWNNEMRGSAVLLFFANSVWRSCRIGCCREKFSPVDTSPINARRKQRLTYSVSRGDCLHLHLTLIVKVNCFWHEAEDKNRAALGQLRPTSPLLLSSRSLRRMLAESSRHHRLSLNAPRPNNLFFPLSSLSFSLPSPLLLPLTEGGFWEDVLTNVESRISWNCKQSLILINFTSCNLYRP